MYFLLNSFKTLRSDCTKCGFCDAFSNMSCIYYKSDKLYLSSNSLPICMPSFLIFSSSSIYVSMYSSWNSSSFLRRWSSGLTLFITLTSDMNLLVSTLWLSIDRSNLLPYRIFISILAFSSSMRCNSVSGGVMLGIVMVFVDLLLISRDNAL